MDDFDIILLSNYGFGAARKDISEMVYNTFFENSSYSSDIVVTDGNISKKQQT